MHHDLPHRKVRLWSRVRSLMDSHLTDLVKALKLEPWRLDLIRSHLKAVQRNAECFNKRYPGEDFEPICLIALYFAAATFRPGPGTFYSWYVWKMRGRLSQVLRRRAKHRAGLKKTGPLKADEIERPRSPPIRLHQLNQVHVDSRYFYRDDE